MRATTLGGAPAPWDRGSAPVLHVSPTGRTNLATGDRPAPGLADGEDLPRELLHAAVKDAAALGYEALVVGGGEPFLAPSLPGLLARARRADLHTTVVTNGLLLGQRRRWAPVAPLIDHLAVELHGLGAEHDAAVHRDGAFAGTIANLEAVRVSGVPFGLQVAFDRVGAAALPGMVELAGREGACEVHVTGVAQPGATEAAALRRARQLGARHGVALRTDLRTRDDLVLFRGRHVPAFPARELCALAPELRIEACGRVRPLGAGVPDRLILGTLRRRRLAAMAPDFLASRRAQSLVEACDATWWSLTAPGACAHGARWAVAVGETLVAAEAAEVTELADAVAVAEAAARSAVAARGALLAA